MSRGVVVALLSVEVLEMELRNTGTAQMELSYRSSEVYTLFLMKRQLPNYSDSMKKGASAYRLIIQAK